MFWQGIPFQDGQIVRIFALSPLADLLLPKYLAHIWNYTSSNYTKRRIYEKRDISLHSN
jgi:hypothetical protein